MTNARSLSRQRRDAVCTCLRRRHRLQRTAGKGFFAILSLPDAPSRPGPFTASGRCEFSTAGRVQGLGRPTTPQLCLKFGPPAGDDFATRTQFLNLRSPKPARHEGSRCWKFTPTCGRAASRPAVASSMIGATTAARQLQLTAPSRQRPGHLVAQAGPGGYQRQPAHQPELTDLGGGPVLPGAEVIIDEPGRLLRLPGTRFQTFSRESRRLFMTASGLAASIAGTGRTSV
jgi:hypothetical protein